MNNQEITSFNMNKWKDIYYKNDYDTSRNWLLANSNNVFPSIYYAIYTEDLPPMEFMVNNRINGYFQELEGTKGFINIGHGRAIMRDGKVIFIWMFTTTEIPDEMKNSSLYQCCSWEKITRDDSRFDTDMLFEEPTNYIDYK